MRPAHTLQTEKSGEGSDLRVHHFGQRLTLGRARVVERDGSGLQRWLLILAGGIVMGASLGIRQVQGLFLLPVTLDAGWSREAFGFAFALQNLVWGLTQPLTGMLADRFGSAKVICGGALIYAIGLMIMAQADGLAQFTWGSGMLVGIGLSGTAFGTIYGAISRLVPPQQRGWALGLAGAVGGLGQFCIVPLVQTLLGRMSWSGTMVVLCGLMVVVAPLAFRLRDNPASLEAGHLRQSMGEAIYEAFGHRGFWLLNLGFLTCGFQLAFIAGHLPTYLFDKQLGRDTAGTAIAILSLSNVLGTFLFGYFGGIWRRKYVLSGLYFARAGAMALFIWLPLSPSGVYAFSFVMGLLWLGTVPLTNGLVSQIFGVRYITTLFSFVFFGHQLGAFFGVWLGGYVFDVTRSYDLIWQVAIGLGLLSAFLHLPINDRAVIREQPSRAQLA